MKINYEDLLDEYDEEDSFQRIKPRKKFRDVEKAKPGNSSHKKELRKKRQAKQRQRENEEQYDYNYEEEDF